MDGIAGQEQPGERGIDPPPARIGGFPDYGQQPAETSYIEEARGPDEREPEGVVRSRRRQGREPQGQEIPGQHRGGEDPRDWHEPRRHGPVPAPEDEHVQRDVDGQNEAGEDRPFDEPVPEGEARLLVRGQIALPVGAEKGHHGQGVVEDQEEPKPPSRCRGKRRDRWRNSTRTQIPTTRIRPMVRTLKCFKAGFYP